MALRSNTESVGSKGKETHFSRAHNYSFRVCTKSLGIKQLSLVDNLTVIYSTNDLNVSNLD